MAKMTQKIEGEVIFGIHPIIELLKAKKRKLYTVYTTKPEPKAWKEVASLLPKTVTIKYVEKNYLNNLAGTLEHQSVVGLAGPFQIRKSFFDVNKHPFLVMVDSIQDTRNLGAILRSAYCTGADGVIICQRKGAPINGSTIKASAGLAERLEIYQASSPAQAITELKKAGYGIYLATLDGADATKVKYTKPVCIVIGNEAIGVSREILKEGTKIRLSQKSDDISYNASVAAGILLFLAASQMGKI